MFREVRVEDDANEEKFEGHTCSGRRFVYPQLSIAAGSVSADPHAGHDMLPCRCQQMRISLR